MKFNMEEHILELTGKKFGRLTLMKYMGRAKDGKHTWLCRCDCGKERVTLENNLKRRLGGCGCISKEITIKRNTTHGLYGDPLYTVWANMRQRCNNANHRDFHRYGGRGISICKEWDSAEAFIKWGHANGYKRGLTLDRRDNDGNYCQDNCRFVTMEVQTRNESSNIWVELNGESKVLTDWAKKLPVSYATLIKRYRKGERGETLLRPGEVGKNQWTMISG